MCNIHIYTLCERQTDSYTEGVCISGRMTYCRAIPIEFHTPSGEDTYFTESIWILSKTRIVRYPHTFSYAHV